MKKRLLVGLAVGVTMFSVAVLANAAVLTFDDIPINTSVDNTPVPNEYGGLNWSNMDVFDPAAYGFGDGYGDGYINGIVSGTQVAYNHNSEMAITSSGGGDFDFNGAWFTSAWHDNNILTVNAFNNGSLVDSTTLALNTSAPQWLAFNVSNIDELQFSTSNYQFVMDNFTYNESAPVPEPATMLLFGTGLAGLVGVRKRKKSA